MIKAVLFDIDGVIIDSLEANFKFYKELLKKVGGKEVTLKEYKPYYSYSTKQMLTKFVPGLSKEEVERWGKYGTQLYNKYYKYVKLEPGIKKLILHLYKRYRLGIVTGRTSVKALEIFGLKKYFELFVTASDYDNPKPNPEPLLMAIKKLGVKPEEVLYIGDSKNDVLAGKRSNVKVIIYKNDKVKGDFNVNDFSKIPQILNTI